MRVDSATGGMMLGFGTEDDARLAKVARSILGATKLPPVLLDTILMRAYVTGIRYCLLTLPYQFPDRAGEILRAHVGTDDTLVIPISKN
jgi:hypothetical protein